MRFDQQIDRDGRTFRGVAQPDSRQGVRTPSAAAAAAAAAAEAAAHQQRAEEAAAAAAVARPQQRRVAGRALAAAGVAPQQPRAQPAPAQQPPPQQKPEQRPVPQGQPRPANRPYPSHIGAGALPPGYPCAAKRTHAVRTPPSGQQPPPSAQAPAPAAVSAAAARTRSGDSGRASAGRAGITAYSSAPRDAPAGVAPAAHVDPYTHTPLDASLAVQRSSSARRGASQRSLSQQAPVLAAPQLAAEVPPPTAVAAIPRRTPAHTRSSSAGPRRGVAMHGHQESAPRVYTKYDYPLRRESPRRARERSTSAAQAAPRRRSDAPTATSGPKSETPPAPAATRQSSAVTRTLSRKSSQPCSSSPATRPPPPDHDHRPPPQRQHSVPQPPDHDYRPPAQRQHPAPQDAAAAWDRLCDAARGDFSSEELGFLYWETLCQLLGFYGITEPCDVARIELRWKELQGSRAAAGGPPPPAFGDPAPVAPPRPGSPSRGPSPPQQYSHLNYAQRREAPVPRRSARSGAPVL
eukprot:TRINITY_DN18773_c0_g2_i2.p1 TRINITY_DN18773_c0_g2~~TRINITY_DN18773_c0_g2_i2.p1  ORF type:complete len:534 (+),score=143.73 TRINITY_DN18773_c0_g2_i2:45-1604(+)